MMHEEAFFLWLEGVLNNHGLSLKEKTQFVFRKFENYSSAFEENNFVIYEDWWIKKTEIVKSKIISLLKLSHRIYARECIVKKINKSEASIFLMKNHLHGSVKMKVKYGLFFKNELYAVATFSRQRQFYDGSRSVELLRYCNKNNFTTVGGLDKLLQAYIKEYQPGSIMTYVDLDWGRGEAFKKLGFEIKETKIPMLFYVNKKSGERIPEKYFKDSEKIKEYIKVSNKGSLKMVKPL